MSTVTRHAGRYPWTTQFLVLGAVLVYIVPIYLLVNLSFKQPSDITNPMIPTATPTLDNFAAAWNQAHLGAALLNSAVVTVTATVLVVVFSSLASYVLARTMARWSRWSFTLFVFGLVLPFQLATVPLYTTFRDLGLIGSLWGLAVLYAGVQLPFAVFVTTTFLRETPRDFEEAALLDGASYLGVWRRVVLPLSRPVSGTVGILTAIFVWNDFYGSLLFLTPSTATVPIALYGFVGTYATEWSLVFAGLVISALPLLVVYLIMQRSIIQGFAGGLKG